MSDADDSNLLARCPRCTYSLRGLPEQHRCPECGLEVDRRWQVFGGRTMPGFSVRSRGFKIWMVVIVAYALGMATLAHLRGAPRMILPYLGFGMLAAGFVWLITRRPQAFVAVGPHGVLIYRGADRVENYPWERIHRARYELVARAMILDVGNQQIYVKTTRFVGLRIGEADRCIMAINHYPRAEPPATARRAR